MGCLKVNSFKKVAVNYTNRTFFGKFISKKYNFCAGFGKQRFLGFLKSISMPLLIKTSSKNVIGGVVLFPKRRFGWW